MIQVIFAVSFTHSEGMIGIQRFRVLEEIIEAIVYDCDNPLKVVDWGTLVPS